MQEVISLSNVTFGTRNHEAPVLESFSLSVEKGDVVILLGPGGSGKSSIFKMLTGELKPDSGEIIVGEKNIGSLSGNHLAEYRRSIGIIVRNAPLLDDRTIAEQMELPLELAGMKSHRRKERVEAVLDRFELQAMRESYPKSLSMSERERAAIARAVAAEPLVLLADEPAANVSAEAAQDIAELLMHENLRGMTMLIGTSDERFASYFPNANIRHLGHNGIQN